MKRILSLLFTALFLSGCNSAPVKSTASAAQTVTPETTLSPAPTSTKTATPPFTPIQARVSPASTLSPIPSAIPDNIETEYLEVVETSAQINSRSGQTTVTDGKVVYYRDDAAVDESEYDLNGDNFYYTRVFRYNRESGKTEELFNTKGVGSIQAFFLADNGDLYYSLNNWEAQGNQGILSRYRDGTIDTIMCDFSNIFSFDGKRFVYSVWGEPQDDEAEQIEYYKLDCETKESVVTEEPTVDTTNRYELTYENKEQGTVFVLLDQNTGEKKQCVVSERPDELTGAVLYQGELYVAGYTYHKDESALFRVDFESSQLVYQAQIDGEILCNLYMDGKWYLYLSGKPMTNNQLEDRLVVCTLSTGKTKLLKSFSVENSYCERQGHLSVTDNILWAYSCTSGDGLCMRFVGKYHLK